MASSSQLGFSSLLPPALHPLPLPRGFPPSGIWGRVGCLAGPREELRLPWTCFCLSFEEVLIGCLGFLRVFLGVLLEIFLSFAVLWGFHWVFGLFVCSNVCGLKGHPESVWFCLGPSLGACNEKKKLRVQNG